MSKILRNDDPINSVDLIDCGVVVNANSSYTIPPQDYPTFAASSDVIRALSDIRLILNDGGNDITILSDAVDIIKGWFPGASALGEDFFFDYFDVPVGVGPHTLFSYTVTFPDVLELSKITVSCRMESIWTVLKDGVVIADLRTGAAKPMDSFEWGNGRSFDIGTLIEIILTKRAGAPDVDVGLYVQGSTTTLTA